MAIRFKQFSKKQMLILTWWRKGSPVRDFDGIICDGSIRAGKTLCMSISFFLWAMENFSGVKFILAGKTVEAFRRNVLDDAKRTLNSHGFIISDNRTTNTMTISYIIPGGEIHTNTFHIFGGNDEKSQDMVQGLTAQGAFFDEAALMPESFISQCTARCSLDGYKIWMNMNPDGPYHFIKRDYIDRADKGELNYLHIHFTMDDNPSLSEDRKNSYMTQYTGVFFQRYILGKWVVAEGLIYGDAFSYEKNVAPIVPPSERGNSKWISIDHGIQNATVFLLWTKHKGKDIWHCEKEYYYSGRDTQKQKTVSETVEDLKKFMAEAIKDGSRIKGVIIDPEAAALLAELRAQNIPYKKAKNAVIPGIELTASHLNQGRLLFDPSCKNILKEFQSYAWDEKASQIGIERPIKTNDHAMDAMRYFAYTKFKNPGMRIVGANDVIK